MFCQMLQKPLSECCSLGVRITLAKFIWKDVRCKLHSSVFIVLFDYNIEQPSSATSTTYHTHTKAQNCSGLMNSHLVFNVVCLTKGRKLLLSILHCKYLLHLVCVSPDFINRSRLCYHSLGRNMLSCNNILHFHITIK